MLPRCGVHPDYQKDSHSAIKNPRTAVLLQQHEDYGFPYHQSEHWFTLYREQR